jgi:hypothetical protein
VHPGGQCKATRHVYGSARDKVLVLRSMKTVPEATLPSKFYRETEIVLLRGVFPSHWKMEKGVLPVRSIQVNPV